MATLIIAAMFFTSCETDATEIAEMANVKAAVAGTPTINYDPTQACTCLMTNYPSEALSAAEADALLFMREEEKLAHDVYVGMKAKWGVNIFSNISTSEQRHMDAILCLINKYKLVDPVGGNGLGVFKNADLQILYNKLMEKGSESLVAALTVGATIEDLDISDLNTRLASVDNADIKAVFNELTRASRNHLRSFNRFLENQGTDYTPQYIGQTLFDEIINSPKETGSNICGICPGTCTGGGTGNGTGNCPNGGNGSGNGTGNCPNGGNGPGNGGSNGPGNGGGNGPGGGNGNGGGK